jgi:hypothetical protein
MAQVFYPGQIVPESGIIGSRPRARGHAAQPGIWLMLNRDTIGTPGSASSHKWLEKLASPTGFEPVLPP